MAKYKKAIESAAELWDGCEYEDVRQNEEFMRGVVQVIAKMFDRDTEEDQAAIRDDILDFAGIYRAVRWDGVRVPIIESDTNPWIQGEDGMPFSFGADIDTFRELTPGVLVYHTQIQRDDTAEFSPESDLHAAKIAADLASRVIGREYTVWFYGTY